MGHPNILPINESENLSENMNKSQKKKKERNPGILNEYYAPAIKFHAFDPRPPEMRGISDAQKKIIDEMFDKNSRRKQKFGSVSGNQENIKGKNVIGEDHIDVGTNSMGQPVTKPNILPINESENLSENMNRSQSRKSKRTPKFLNEYYAPAIEFQAFDPRPPDMRGISNAQKEIIDQMFEKKSKRKPKVVKKSMEYPTKKDPLQILTNTMEHPINEDPIQIGTYTMGQPNILPMSENENLSENMNKSQRKEKKRNPGFLNEYYAPAIEFQAFDP